MAARFQVIIPADPTAPLPPKATMLKDALAAMVGTTEARVKDFGRLQFIDCGDGIAHISCPACDAKPG